MRGRYVSLFLSYIYFFVIDIQVYNMRCTVQLDKGDFFPVPIFGLSDSLITDEFPYRPIGIFKCGNRLFYQLADMVIYVFCLEYQRLSLVPFDA